MAIGNVVAVDNLSEEELIQKIAELPTMDMNSVENYGRYKEFVDNMNNLIYILNRNEMFDITPFEATRGGWEKASKLITEYGPLIDNYNEVINASKNHISLNNEESKKTFYIASGKFAFEAGLIVFTVYYSAAYTSVGIVYRSVGLNKLALKHPMIIKIVLSQAHWFVRTVLVESSSQIAQEILEIVSEYYN